MPRNHKTPEFRVIVRWKNNRLFLLRINAGLTQAQIAGELDVSMATYAAMENLNIFPHMKNGEPRKVARRLAEFWGQSFNWLFPAPVVQGQVNRFVEELWTNHLPAHVDEFRHIYGDAA